MKTAKREKHRYNNILLLVKFDFRVILIWFRLNPQEGDSRYVKGGAAHRKFWIKPLKETDVDVAQVFFDP